MNGLEIVVWSKQERVRVEYPIISVHPNRNMALLEIKDKELLKVVVC